MTDDELTDGDEYFGRGFDHLETIATIVQSLRGDNTLAYELIQNADDAAGATELVFRFTRDALEVIDNGGFESCGELQEKVCPWERERSRRKGKKRCDFHGFRRLAGASKREAADLTGAFGVGFLSVYQVTDRPELISAGQHWIIDDSEPDERRRIRGCKACTRDHAPAGTIFRLPWAATETEMRTLLGAPTVPPTRQRAIYDAFRASIPGAMLFLHKLASITLEHPGEPTITFRREPTDDGVRITGDGHDEQWLILKADFGDAVEELRETSRWMRDRPSSVRVAVLPGGNALKGLVHATLPTQFITGLPLHVDASFFPSPDRKSILLEGPEGEWNLAAIERAGELVAEHLEELAHRLGSRPFWRLIRAAYDARSQPRRGVGDSFTSFWPAISAALGPAVVMETARGEWAVVQDTVLPGHKDPDDWTELLEDLGIPTPAPTVQKAISDFRRAVPCQSLSLDRLLDGLDYVGLNVVDVRHADLPAGLGALARRNLLRRRLSEFIDDGVSTAARPRLRALALWRAENGHYTSFDGNWLVDADTVEAFPRAFDYPLVIRSRQDEKCTALLAVGDPWGVEEAIGALSEEDSSALPTAPDEARAVLDWLQARLGELSDEGLQQLADLPLLPTDQGLSAPTACVIPGGFCDPLGATRELRSELVARYERLFDKLDIQRLGFADFVLQFAPDALAGGRRVSADALLRLLDAAADNRRAFDDDPRVGAVLRGLAWVLCSDCRRRTPAQVYFDTELVRDVLGAEVHTLDSRIPPSGANADLLRALGVSRAPRPGDVAAHLATLHTEPVDDRRVSHVLRVLEYLQPRVQSLDDRVRDELAGAAWLPAQRHTGGRFWSAPADTFFTHDRRYFELTGAFLALPRTAQDQFGAVLGTLGVRRQPPVPKVVANVIALTERGQSVDVGIVRWLNSDGHPGHEAIAGLAGIRWLVDTDGQRRAPGEVFRTTPERLARYFPALADGLRGFDDLLDALDVAQEPSCDDATALLLRFAAEDSGRTGGPPREAVRECWAIIDRDREYDVLELESEPVLLATGSRLYRADEVIVDDLSSVAGAFDDETRNHFVRPIDQAAALRLGAPRLSGVARSRVVHRGGEVDADHVAERITARQKQLAQIVIGEHGRWESVLELASALTVTGYVWLTVERYLDGFDDLAPSAETAVGAHYLGDGKLVVAIQAGRADWFEIAHELRSILCPDASPSVTVAIEGALAPVPDGCADKLLRRLGYVDLDPEHWEELHRRLEEQHARRAELASPADADQDDLDDEASNPQPEWSATDGAVDDASVEPEPAVATESNERQPEWTNVNAPPPAVENVTGGEDAERTGAGDAAGESADGGYAGAGHGGAGTRNGSRAGSTSRSNGPAPASANRSGHGKGSAHGNGASLGSGTSSGAGTHGHGAGGGRSPSTPPKRTEHEWWQMIVSSSSTAEDGALGEEGREQARSRAETDEAGMVAVEGYEERQHRHPQRPDYHNNPGFDLVSRDDAGTIVRYIEVKSLAGAWGPDGFPKLTPEQWRTALEQRDRFWVYVVEHAKTQPHLTRIQDPAGRATRYVLDPGWRELHEALPGEPVPEAGSIDAVEELLRSLGH